MRRLREPCWIFLAANQSLSLYCYNCPWVQVSSYECMPVLISVCHSSFLEIYSYTLLYWTLQLLSLRFFASTTHTLNLVCCHEEPFSWLVRIYSSHNAIWQHNILQCPKLTVSRFYTYICHSSIVSFYSTLLRRINPCPHVFPLQTIFFKLFEHGLNRVYVILWNRHFFLHFTSLLHSYVVKSTAHIFFIPFGNGNIYVPLHGLFKFPPTLGQISILWLKIEQLSYLFHFTSCNDTDDLWFSPMTETRCI